MLTHLNIVNYALIEKMSLSIKDGFTTITGETGAGKSILLGGLGLILGNRFDTSVLMDSTKKCVIEATFDISKYQLKDFFEAQDLDYEIETVIRRELTPSGKSRAFINDTPVRLDTLQQLKEYLIDIHSQHETLQINDLKFQYQVLDDLASCSDDVKQYQKDKKEYEKLNKNLSELKQAIAQDKQQHDYLLHLHQELVQADIKLGLLEELETKHQYLSHIELIQNSINEANQLFNDDEKGLIVNLYKSKHNLHQIHNYNTQYAALYQRMENSYAELEDISRELATISDNLENADGNIDEVNAKIHLLKDLMSKHNVVTEEELLQIKTNLSEKIQNVTEADDTLQQKQQEIEQFQKQLNKQAQLISKKRCSYSTILGEKVSSVLHNLGMPNAVFKVSLQDDLDFNPYGKNKLQWLFSANKGIEPASVKQVASGGELSRIILAIKHLWSEKAHLPTIIFDEIDTGVSGDIALKMGEIMQQMAHYMQVISITHLPQIASKGQQHLKVYKIEVNAVTQSKVTVLNPKERQREIAEMLGGKDVTASALKHAAELLK